MKRKTSTAPRRREPAPPIPTQRPVATVHHGETRVDEYAWLADRDDPAVMAHLRAENRYAAKVLRPYADLRRALYREIRRRFSDRDVEVPERVGPYLYYRRYRRGERYPVFCRRLASPRGAEEVVLDLNQIASATRATYVALGGFEVSPDHRRLAYTLDLDGKERFTLFVKELAGDQLLGRQLRGLGRDIAWAADSATLFVCRLDTRGRPKEVLRCRVGESGDAATVVFQEPDERFFVSCVRARSGRYIFVEAASGASSETWFLDAGDPRASLRLVRARREGCEYTVDHHGRHFYIVTNDDALDFKVVRAPLERPWEWRDFIPHRPDRLVEGIQLFSRYLVVIERHFGLRRIRVVDIARRRRHLITFDEPAYTIVEHSNPEFDTDLLRFTYCSPLTPAMVYDYDMTSRARRRRKTTDVRGGFDPSRYKLERFHARAADGARVPITLVRLRSTRRDGRNPLVLQVYGAYGTSTAPDFSASRFSLIDRGFVYAIAHVRGGQELGRSWYESGKLLRKRNTFDDYVSCAEDLVARRYTSAGSIVASGVSAGGMVLGVVANERPELFRALVTQVPFVDVLGTMLDPTQTLTAIEYDEWGDPSDPTFYRYIRAYAPYDNVRARDYPDVLVQSALNDARVPFWEPAKWVARLRARRTDAGRVLLLTSMSAGHGGRSGRFEPLKESAIEQTFVLMAFGLAERSGQQTARETTARRGGGILAATDKE